MAPGSWAVDREQDVNRITVQRPKINRLREEGMRDRGSGDVQHDRVAHVGDGDAVADGRRSRRFPREEETQEQLPVHALGQGQDLDQGTKRLVLAGVLKLVVDAAGFQGLGQAGDGLGVCFEVIEPVQGNFHIIRGGPLQQLRPVDAVLSGNLLRGQTSLLDPARDRGLRHV